MHVFVATGFLVLTTLTTWGILRIIRTRTQQSGKAYAGGFLLAALAPGILLVLLILGLSIADYDGTCYGFTDGAWSCTFNEFLSIELGWGGLLYGPIVGLAVIAIGGAFLGGWLKARKQAE